MTLDFVIPLARLNGDQTASNVFIGLYLYSIFALFLFVKLMLTKLMCDGKNESKHLEYLTIVFGIYSSKCLEW